MEAVAYLGETIRRWQVGRSTFLVHPERGARLMHWHVELGDGTLREVVHWPDKVADAAEFPKVRGGNPILFPFNARTFHAGEIHAWRSPDGQKRPMPMHGIARQGTFRTTRLSERGFTAQLVPDDAARAAYPFDYEFEVTYHFAATALTCELTLRNLGREPLPWSAGHHFYFAAPWTEGQTRADYLIRIAAARTLKQDAAGQLVPGPAVAAEGPLDRPELVDTIHAGLKSPEVVFGPKGAPGEVRVRLGTQKVPPPEAVFVTWTQAADAPFYCVEPWMGPPNAAEHGTGLHWVAPGKTQSFVVEVEVR